MQRVRLFLERKTYLFRKAYILMGAPFSAEPENDNYDITRRLVIKTKQVVEKSGAVFVLVSAPMNNKNNQHTIADLCDKTGILYLALDDLFEEVTVPTSFYDGHWNSAGHSIAADAVENFMKVHFIFR
jgi:hypothetical protein